MFPFKSRPEATPTSQFLKVLGSLALASGLGGLSLLNPGVKDAAIAAGNKYLGLGMSLDAPWWVGVPILGFSGIMVALGVWLLRKENSDTGGKPFFAFRHHSLRNAVPPLLTAASLPRRAGGNTLSHIDCDLTVHLADGRPSNADLISAVNEQKRQIDRLFGSVRTVQDAANAYYGIAHVPFQVLAGRMFGPALSPELYELDGDRATWRPLSAGKGADLSTSRMTVPAVGRLTDAVIRVSISLEVGCEDVKQVVPEPHEDIHIRVAHPARNIITHLAQVDEICREFRTSLDSLHNRLAPGGRIHLFLAVPMSVGFSLGRVLSSSLNGDAVCYNHSAQAAPRYSWGIRVNSDEPAAKLIVRPELLSCGTSSGSV